MCKNFINCAIHLFPFYFNASGRSGCFEFLFWYSSIILLSKMKSLFSACESLPNLSCHFGKHKSVFLQILHQSSVPANITSQYFFSSNIIYLGQKDLIKVQIFETFECSIQVLSKCGLNFEITSQFLFKFCIILHCHDT